MSDVENKTKLVAVLDTDNRLIGYKEKSILELTNNDVIVPHNVDLPTDGTYKWVAQSGTFLPLGTGFNKPKFPPFSDTHAMYLMLKHMAKKDDTIMDELKEWMEWYETNILPATAERLTAKHVKRLKRRNK